MKAPICKTCNTTYPSERANMGYRICVACSTEERWSAIPVTYHKTGNTIEVVKDLDDAIAITSMMTRSGFGLMRGMKGFKTQRAVVQDGVPPTTVAQAAPATQSFLGNVVGRRKMPLDYEGVGMQMMSALEQSGKEAALSVVNCAEAEWKLLPSQAQQLRYIIDTVVI